MMMTVNHIFMDAEIDDEDGISYTTFVGPAASSFLILCDDSVTSEKSVFRSYVLLVS